MKGAATFGAVVAAGAALLSRQRRLERDVAAAFEERERQIGRILDEHGTSVNRVLKRFGEEVTQAFRQGVR